METNKQLYLKDNVIVTATKHENIHKVFLNDTKTNTIKFVGIIDIENKTYHKSVEESDHFFKKFNGYGISHSVLKMLKMFGISNIEFTKVETGDKYSYTLDKFTSSPSAISYDNDGDMQQVLSIFESVQYTQV